MPHLLDARVYAEVPGPEASREEREGGTEVKITVEGVPAAGSKFWTLISRYASQIPFATSRAINELAKEVRLHIIDEYLPGKFTIRRRSLLTNRQVGVRMQFSNKRNLEALVYSKFEPWRLFEQGGEQRARRKVRTIPNREALGVDVKQLIPRSKRAKALRRQHSVFQMTTKSGLSGLWRRVGDDLKLLYVYKNVVKIKRWIDTQAEAAVIVTKRYAYHFGQQLGKAIATRRDK